MPEHTSFISYLLSLLPGLSHNAEALGTMVMSHRKVGEGDVEPFVTAVLVALFVVGLASTAGSQLKSKKAIIPDDKPTLRTFIEVFVGYFYGIAKDIMGGKRAKMYFPVIGTCALFIFFSNLLGLIPGMVPPTSSLNITLGCSLLVFLYFNFEGLRANGVGYIKHLFGPWLGPAYVPVNILLFFIEGFSLFVRLLTLSVRLMINIAVDHLILSIFLGLVAVVLPLPVMLLGVIVIVVQTLVFCLLASIYVGLATEHEEHH